MTKRLKTNSGNDQRIDRDAPYTLFERCAVCQGKRQLPVGPYFNDNSVSCGTCQGHGVLGHSFKTLEALAAHVAALAADHMPQ